jgi:hypothetical protein
MGSRTIRFTGKNMVEVSKFMEFLSVVLAALEKE